MPSPAPEGSMRESGVKDVSGMGVGHQRRQGRGPRSVGARTTQGASTHRRLQGEKGGTVLASGGAQPSGTRPNPAGGGPAQGRGGGRVGGAGGGGAIMRSLLPINSLRNAALLAADTPMVAMIDVDLLISKGLSDSLLPRGAGDAKGSVAQRRVWILPAFETSPRLGMDQGTRVAEDAVGGE